MMRAWTITLPLDAVERLFNALDRYVESEGGFALQKGDDEALTLIERELTRVKERTP